MRKRRLWFGVLMAEVENIEDNIISPFQIGKGEVRGRIVRLGDALDKALCGAHYPEAVARLLGEAALIASLVGLSLKFDGRLLVQAHGTNEGAVSLLVAECNTQGNIRSYARYDEAALARIMKNDKTPTAKTLMGGGTFAMTIDSDIHKERYQGIAAIEGDNLSDAAENYFATSEQIPTSIKLAVGHLQQGEEQAQWRGGGILVQKIAGDENRSDSEESWVHAKAVMATVKPIELLDPDLPMERLLYRLFHEQGVRIEKAKKIIARCSCSEEALLATIRTFDKKAREEMLEDGKVTADCQFCQTQYVFSKNDIGL